MRTIKTKDSLFFKGRSGDPRLGEIVAPTPIEDLHTSKQPSLAILGAPDDLGVRLNRGRPGAQSGPDAVREALYKFALPRRDLKKFRLIDVGNIHVSDQILENHENAFNAASIVSGSGSSLVAIGGGHDYAAPHILGAFSGISSYSKLRKFGVINVDPHLDVREFENNLPHSGTPFRQILESGLVKGKDLIQFGAREGRNAQGHFDFCKKNRVKIHEFEELRRGKNCEAKFKACLDALSKVTDKIAVTIDMDSCSEVDGASAAAVIGFSAWELCQFARLAGRNKKVTVLEIAELAPSLDSTGRSARIAAEVVFSFILGQLERSDRR